MPRVQERSLKPIKDDLDPKGGVVAWYDVTNPKLTYADEDGNTAAEPTALWPIPDPDDPDQWIMAEVWTSPANKKKYIDDLTARLNGADSAGVYVVKEKKEWDDLLNQIKELEEENAELRKRPATGGKKERAAYGSGTPRADSKHKRIWLHVNGFEITAKGRFNEEQNKAFDTANPSGTYKFTPEEEAAYDEAMGKPVQPTLPTGEGDEGGAEALSRVRRVAGAPEAQEDAEDDDLTDDEMRNLLRGAKEAAKPHVPLTQAQIDRAYELRDEKDAADA